MRSAAKSVHLDNNNRRARESRHNTADLSSALDLWRARVGAVAYRASVLSTAASAEHPATLWASQ
eukprot:CAMPEP_0170217206 /NCGR_PEP_ID=MMETSP0116_2-20130129/8265_1 /TAXON_ID=400756 /ORGANISM="Durinskia baltica, Strain CSIRO CS-38" /LENGTH=64 /DNA_ID=CAMNT_0010467833 /DNA_START=140 /DNA_END=331 /DNA_ORIENTATION=-